MTNPNNRYTQEGKTYAGFNMWGAEGSDYTQKDHYNKEFELLDGDVVFYHAGKKSFSLEPYAIYNYSNQNIIQRLHSELVEKMEEEKRRDYTSELGDQALSSRTKWTYI